MDFIQLQAVNQDLMDVREFLSMGKFVPAPTMQLICHKMKLRGDMSPCSYSRPQSHSSDGISFLGDCRSDASRGIISSYNLGAHIPEYLAESPDLFDTFLFQSHGAI